MNIYNKKNGGLTGQISAHFGMKEDAEFFEKDVEFLGFGRVAITKSEREFNGAMHTTYKVSHNGAFASFMTCLGITMGHYCEVSRLPVPTWVMNGSFRYGQSAFGIIIYGDKTLSATLDRVRITTQNGTDTFDAGSINILYE
jgi:hypothetical protein